MMRKFKKRFGCSMLVCVLLVCLFVSPIYASTMTNVSGSIDGAKISGSLVMTSSSATANVSFSRGGGTRDVQAVVYYWWGDLYYCTIANNSSSQSGGVAATAKKKLGGAEVVAAKGYHYLEYGAYTWKEITRLGTIPSKSTVL